MSARTTGVALGIERGNTARFPHADRVSTFKIFRWASALRRRLAPDQSGSIGSDWLAPMESASQSLFALLLDDVPPDKGTIDDLKES